MARLRVLRHLGQRDTEIVKYERYKIGIKPSIGLYWIQTARGALTTYNHHRIKERDKASFFSFMLVLREFLIPFTSKYL